MMFGFGKLLYMLMTRKAYTTSCKLQISSLFQQKLKHLQTKDGKHIEAFIVRDPDGHAMLIEENDRSEVAVKINKHQQIKIRKAQWYKRVFSYE